MANIEVGLLETEKQLSSMIEASGKSVPQPCERANIVDHLDYIIQLLGTMVSDETFEAAKEKMANGYNAINDRIEIVNYLLASGEISGDVDMEPLTVTENGEYMPGAGHAFGRVVVSTPEAVDKVPELLARAFTTFEHDTTQVIGFSAFKSYPWLTRVNFPACTTIKKDAFYSCTSLSSVSFPTCITVGSSAFAYCYKLKSLYLLGSSIVSLAPDCFWSTPIAGYTQYTDGQYGSIFVPASLVDQYKSAPGWRAYSSRITAYIEP